MAERITGRPWSAYEDLLLSRAVAEFDGEADWKTIAQHVPGRTNKACRKVCYFFLIIIYPFISRTSLDPILAMASLPVPIDQEIGMD
jgi:Myb-like DNA-binding domain